MCVAVPAAPASPYGDAVGHEPCAADGGGPCELTLAQIAGVPGVSRSTLYRALRSAAERAPDVSGSAATPSTTGREQHVTTHTQAVLGRRRHRGRRRRRQPLRQLRPVQRGGLRCRGRPQFRVHGDRLRAVHRGRVADRHRAGHGPGLDPPPPPGSSSRASGGPPTTACCPHAPCCSPRCLLAVGVPALEADVVNLVAVVVCC